MILNLTKLYPKAEVFFADEKVFSRDANEEEKAQLKLQFGIELPGQLFPTRDFKFVEMQLSKFGDKSVALGHGDVVLMGDDMLAIDLVLEQSSIGKSAIVKLIVSVMKKERFGGATFARPAAV